MTHFEDLQADAHQISKDNVFPATVLIPSTISQEKFKTVVEDTREALDPTGISGTQHLTTKYVARIAELVLQGIGIEITPRASITEHYTDYSDTSHVYYPCPTVKAIHHHIGE